MRGGGHAHIYELVAKATPGITANFTQITWSLNESDHIQQVFSVENWQQPSTNPGYSRKYESVAKFLKTQSQTANGHNFEVGS